MRTKEFLILQLNREADLEKRSLLLFDDVKKLIEAYDNKVINKRFDTALKKINENLSLKMEYNSFSIKACYYSLDDRYIRFDNQGGYIKRNEFYVMYGCISSYDGKNILADENRLIAKNAVEALESQKLYSMNHIARLEKEISEIDNIINDYNNLVDQLAEINREWDYTIRDYLEINIPYLRKITF